MHDNLLKDLSDLKKYGEKLSKKGVEKGKKAIDIADEIFTKIQSLNQYLPSQARNKHHNHKQQLNILATKLDILDILHRHDTDFQVHRGYGSLVGNIFATLFSAGFANLINKAVTGDWLFFKTSTATQVSKIHHDLGIGHEHLMKFTPK